MRFHYYTLYTDALDNLKENKLLISTINAHSFNVAETDSDFRDALISSQILIPDGISVVWAIKWLKNYKIKKIAGADLFFYEMNRLQQNKGKCFFLGSTESTLEKIKDRSHIDYPDVIVETFSPPYKVEFTEEDSQLMINKINSFNPDVLFIGLTAPKQEKWAHRYFNELEAGHIACIGAVFDFYAGTIKRAPKWMITLGLEWFYRLVNEPKRLWRRYLIGNLKFLYFIFNEKVFGKS